MSKTSERTKRGPGVVQKKKSAISMLEEGSGNAWGEKKNT